MRAVADGAGMMIWMPEWMSNRAAMVVRGLLVSLVLALCAIMRPALGPIAASARMRWTPMARRSTSRLRARTRCAGGVIDGASGELARGQDDAWTSTRGWTGNPMDTASRSMAATASNSMASRRTASRCRCANRLSPAAAARALAGRLVLPPGEGRGAHRGTGARFRNRFGAGLGLDAAIVAGRGRRRVRVRQARHRSFAGHVHPGFRRARGRCRRRREPSAAPGGAIAPARIGAPRREPLGVGSPAVPARTHVDFAIVVFGLAVSPLREDHEAVEFQMRAKGHGDDEIRRGLGGVRCGRRDGRQRVRTRSVEAFIAARAAARGKVVSGPARQHRRWCCRCPTTNCARPNASPSRCRRKSCACAARSTWSARRSTTTRCRCCARPGRRSCGCSAADQDALGRNPAQAAGAGGRRRADRHRAVPASANTA